MARQGHRRDDSAYHVAVWIMYVQDYWTSLGFSIHRNIGPEK